MSEGPPTSGSCLCGAVTLKASKLPRHFGACHCGTCRKWGGGPMMSVDCGKEVEIDGEEAITVFDSSQWAERGFCNRCGTHLFYRLKATQQYHVPLGLFGDDAAPKFGVQVFIDKKPDTYAFANETKVMTAAEIFALYAPKS